MNFLDKTTASSLKKEGEEILGIFTKTKDKLEKLTIRQKQYSDDIKSQIAMLNAEKELVEQDIQSNNTVINKIKAILT